MSDQRRRAIEHLCRLYLNRQITLIQECEELVVPHCPDIEAVGYILFNQRPANLVYVAVFLEYVLRVNESSDQECLTSAVNVLEKTAFDPPQTFHTTPVFFILKYVLSFFRVIYNCFYSHVFIYFRSSEQYGSITETCFV